MKTRVEVYEKGDVKMISEEEINEARKDLVKYGTEWRKRKRECMNMIDVICEGADLNRKEFIVSQFIVTNIRNIEKARY
jgi:hypothetical protein